MSQSIRWHGDIPVEAAWNDTLAGILARQRKCFNPLDQFRLIIFLPIEYRKLLLP